MTLEEGLETVRVAEAVLESARTGETRASSDAGRRRRAGQDRAAAGGADRQRRPRGRRLRHRRARRRARARRACRRSPTSRASRRRCRSRRRTDTAAPPCAGADLVVLVPPLMVDARRRARLARVRRRRRATSRAACRPGTTVVDRDDGARSAPRATASRAADARRACTSAFSPERVSSGRVLRDLATYPKLVGGLDAEGEARAVELYASFITEAEVWADGQRRGCGADEAGRDDLPRRQHRASPTSSRATPTSSGSTSSR